MQRYIAPFTIRQFAHQPEAKLLLADMSDLGVRAGDTPFEQLYDDACDIGIALLNPRTGSTTYWYYVAEVKERDEITMWILQPTTESCRLHPGVQCYTMHIYNG